MNSHNLTSQDKQIADIIAAEHARQRSTLNMIPSENYTSPAVREAVGSVLMHKYSEGNVGKRYYEGNQFIDELETLAIERARELFNLPENWDVNVQALSGSNANLAVYMALLEPGDTIMGMFLPDGGHLSHGWSYEPGEIQDPANVVYKGGKRKVNITSRIFNAISYKTDPATQLLDYDQIARIAAEYQPKILISGGTAYPRLIDHKRMKQIAEAVGAYYMADIAHEAGLVAANVIPSPVGIADIVTMTTHKTLRAARGAIILASKDIIAKVNRSILPGLQGGPFDNNIAGIAVGLGEALQPEFKQYAVQVIQNTQTLARNLQAHGFKLVSDGADKHLILIDLTNKGITGKYAAKALAAAGIIVNMNTMPAEKRSPADPSAIRIGTPFLTTQGMKEAEMELIGAWIDEVLTVAKGFLDLPIDDFIGKLKTEDRIQKIKSEIEELTAKYPLA